ncbi:hypothetical protein TcasGA2_TC014186 [Tribolium castaneum]|uniref:Uncharacterized protein n=1 Tax=Tribolium castaneum TaxID=7070 RepID=D6W6W9_TRICA|nr:hypothetical protein TcasGA2_TC014186 [Tribolium castaneum]
MWVQETWETEEDVEKDIRLMAEYVVPLENGQDSRERKVPETILQYRKLMEENRRKPLNSDLDDYIWGRVVPVGELVEPQPLDEAKLIRKIREVSGFGYSNELIENYFKAKVYDLPKDREINPCVKPLGPPTELRPDSGRARARPLASARRAGRSQLGSDASPRPCP